MDLKNFRNNDKQMQEAAGVSFLRLNGCVKCHKFVYLPQDRRTHCPQVLEGGVVCGGPRFDDEGHSLEVFFNCLFCCYLLLLTFWHYTQQRVLYFPLKPRLEKLLQIPSYCDMLQHEYRRPRNSEYLTDVYDGDEWKKFMGAPSLPCKRMGCCYCIDSFPANKEGSVSVKPGGIMNLSLPPTQRAKPENMLVLIVIPTGVKDFAQRKYYDWMASFELNSLFHEG